MKKLIVNADDFGYREGINKGIVYAYQHGVVSSASLFVERDGSEEAIRLAKENPGLGLGAHIDLDKFFEVDHQHGAITGWSTPRPDINNVRTEIRRQLEKYYSLGFTADHLNSHHHAHMIPEVFPIACELAREFKIPVIRFFDRFYSDADLAQKNRAVAREFGLVLPDHFIEGWYWGNVDEPFHVAELMTHPGYGELWREAELAHCCQPQLKQYFVEQKIDLIRFCDLVSR